MSALIEYQTEFLAEVTCCKECPFVLETYDPEIATYRPVCKHDYPGTIELPKKNVANYLFTHKPKYFAPDCPLRSKPTIILWKGMKK
jgi:hypothetical protein